MRREKKGSSDQGGKDNEEKNERIMRKKIRFMLQKGEKDNKVKYKEDNEENNKRMMRRKGRRIRRRISKG